MRVAPSGRTASAIKRSNGSARNPVRYAMETGRVRYTASSRRFAIHRWTAAIGVAAATALLNCRDAHRVGAARSPDLDRVADAVSDQRLAQGRLVAHPAGFGIRLGGADDPVCLLVRTVLGEPLGAAHVLHPRRAVLFADPGILAGLPRPLGA